MLTQRYFVIVAFLITTMLTANAKEKPTADGTWLIQCGYSCTHYRYMGAMKFESKDGKPTLSYVADANDISTPLTFTNVEIVGTMIRFQMKKESQDFSFEGTLDPKNPKRIYGNFTEKNDRVWSTILEKTHLEKIDEQDTRFEVKVPPVLEELRQLEQAWTDARRKADAEPNEVKRAKLHQENKDSLQQLTIKTDAAYREAVKLLDNPYSISAAKVLLMRAVRIHATPQEVAGWAKMVTDDNKKFGARYEQSCLAALASEIVWQNGFADIAMPYAERAVLVPNMGAEKRMEALKVLAKVQKLLSKTDLLKRTQAEIAKLDDSIDAEYLANEMPFTPSPYLGRTAKSANRVAVMEQFVGAQSHYCRDAEVAFHGLLKSYKPRDVVLIQYHLHIEGPDPLTNTDSIDRNEYYAQLTPGFTRGVNSALYNGVQKSLPNVPNMNGLGEPEKWYKQFGSILNTILEESIDIKLTGDMKRFDDKLSVTVVVDTTGAIGLTDSVKLRLIVVEDTVRHVGLNGIRFHHHVARSLLGTGKGISVKDLKDGKYTLTQSVKTLEADLNKYLNEYNAKRPFPGGLSRLSALKGLKVIAIIQDDSSGEILQAIQFGIGAA